MAIILFQLLKQGGLIITPTVVSVTAGADGIASTGGLHPMLCGIGPASVAVAPQTLHTLDEGIAA